MELLNLGTTLAAIMKTAGWNPAAFRAYLQFRLAEESDMKAALLQFQSPTHSESEGEMTDEVSKSDYEPPVSIQGGANPPLSNRPAQPGGRKGFLRLHMSARVGHQDPSPNGIR